jgi:hypothetical protein
MQTDNQTLLDNVERTFELAVDPDLTDEQRDECQRNGTELRARLVTLMAARFEEGTQDVLAANAKIREVNAILKKNRKDLEGIAQTVKAVADLVSIVDDLFKLPFSFV